MTATWYTDCRNQEELPIIIVTARVQTNPENLDALKQAMQVMQQASQAEQGCQDYAFSVELGDDSVLRVTERWDDMAALEFHFSTPHMAAFNQALKDYPPAQADIKVYEVAKEVSLPRRSG